MPTLDDTDDQDQQGKSNIVPTEPKHTGSESASQIEVVDATPSCISGIYSAESQVNSPDGPARDGGLPFQKLGHYQILSRLGHGGMGEVYLGYERGLDRKVAIKVLPARFACDADLVRRFHSEAMAAAKLVHPNIIQIYYIGEDAGHTFFAMQYVDGMSLARLMSQGRRLTLEESLAIADEVLSGLAAAHKLGLVHRDIKPGNILLDRVHRRALLADFGLVKSLQESEMRHTSSGVILGTADYIAPEQGLGKPVDCRSDLYSMGVVMFQMLCGRLPFIARESTAVIFQHVYVAPPAFTEMAPHVPQALAAVVERLLAKSPDDRYQSAAEALVDLRAFRAALADTTHDGSHGSTAAEPDISKAGLRVPSPTGKIEASLIADERTSAAGGPQSDTPSKQPDRGRRRVIAVLAAAVGVPAVAAGFWYSREKPPQAVDPMQQRPGIPDTGQTASEAKVPVEIHQFRDHPSEVNCFALTPDESLLIVGDRTNKLSIWDFRMTELRKTFRAHSGPIRRVIVTAEGKYAVTASADQTLKLWDLANWKQVTQFNGHVDVVSSVVQVPGRDEIVSSSIDGRLRRWSLDKGTPLAWYGAKPLDESEPVDFTEGDPQTFERHLSWVRDLVIPRRGNQIISAGNDRVIMIWDLESARVVKRLVEHRAPIMCLAVSPDGSRLLSGGYDKTLCLWDLDAQRLIRHMPHDSATPACVSFSPDGQQSLSGGADGLIHVWEVATGSQQHEFEGHEGTVTSLRYTADGRHIVSGGEDRTIRVWRLPAIPAS
jgi:serine/threonine protein kinase